MGAFCIAVGSSAFSIRNGIMNWFPILWMVAALASALPASFWRIAFRRIFGDRKMSAMKAITAKKLVEAVTFILYSAYLLRLMTIDLPIPDVRAGADPLLVLIQTSTAIFILTFFAHAMCLHPVIKILLPILFGITRTMRPVLLLDKPDIEIEVVWTFIFMGLLSGYMCERSIRISHTR